MCSEGRRLLDRSEILAQLRNLLPELRRNYSVQSLALFGSYAKHTARPESDIDILVEFDQTPSLLRLIALEQYLGDLLGRRVDLVMRRALRPEIGQKILPDIVRV
jgi:uncharacterized protein